MNIVYTNEAANKWQKLDMEVQKILCILKLGSLKNYDVLKLVKHF